MHKKALKYSSVGLGFAILSINVFRYAGISQDSITVVSYLFLLMGLVLVAFEELELDSLGDSPLGRIVIASEGETLRLKRIVTGEVYEIKGEVEKVQ